MSKKYYIEHPTKKDTEIEIPRQVSDTIIKDFMLKTYYWSVGILCFMIGFVLGVAIK